MNEVIAVFGNQSWDVGPKTVKRVEEEMVILQTVPPYFVSSYFFERFAGAEFNPCRPSFDREKSITSRFFVRPLDSKGRLYKIFVATS